MTYYAIAVIAFGGGNGATLAQQSSDIGSSDATALPPNYELSADFSIDDSDYELEVASGSIAPSAGTSIITSEEIAMANVSSTDELLPMVTGLEIIQHGSEGKGHQLLLRGFDAAHGSDVEVLLMGISLNEPSHVHGQGYLDLYGIIPETISEMTAHKGPFLPWQGNFATAGSLTFQLAIPAALRPGIVKTEVDIRGKLRGVVVWAPQQKDRFVATEAVYDHGFATNRQARRAALTSQYAWPLRHGGTLTTTLLAQTARFETPGTNRLDNSKHFYHSPTRGDGISDRLIGRIGYQRESEHIHFELYGYQILRDFMLEENFTGYLFYPERGDRKRQSQRGAVSGVHSAFTYRFGDKVHARWHTGMGWRMDVQQQSEQQIDVQRRKWQNNRHNDFAINQLTFHSGIQLSLLPFWDIYPSVHMAAGFYDVADRLLSQNAGDAFVAVSPRFGMTFPFNETVQLFTNYGRGFRLPEARAVIQSTDHEDNDASQYSGGAPQNAYVDTIESGVALHLTHDTSLQATGFGIWMEKEMLFDHVSNLNLERDGTRRYGVELAVNTQPLPWLRATADFTFVDARFNQSGNPVPGAPKLLSTADIILGRNRGPHGNLGAFWMGQRHLAHGATMEGFATIDVAAGWRFTHFDINMVVDNLTNNQYMEGAYHFASWFERDTARSAIPTIHYVAGKPLTVRFVFTAYI